MFEMSGGVRYSAELAFRRSASEFSTPITSSPDDSGGRFFIFADFKKSFAKAVERTLSLI